MGDLDLAEKNIIQLIDTCNKELKGLTKKNPSERLKQINRCQNRLAEIQVRIDDFGLEILQLDKTLQPRYDQALKSLQKQYKELRKELNLKKAEKGADGNPLTESLLNKELDQMNGMVKNEVFINVNRYRISKDGR